MTYPVTLALCFLFLFDYVYILEAMSFPRNCDKKSEKVATLQGKENHGKLMVSVEMKTQRCP